MITLISFSGGVDSTLVLYRAAVNTDEEIVCFRMDFSRANVLFEKNAIAESVCARRVVNWISSEIRPVSYEIVPVNRFPDGGFISLAALQTARTFTLRGPCRRFIYSRSMENERNAKRLPRLRETWAQMDPHTPMETPLIDSLQGRPHAFAILPQQLRALMLSCDEPKLRYGEPRACGKCNKCFITWTTTQMLKEGHTPDEVFAFYLQKMGVGPYIGDPNADPQYMAGANLRPWINYPAGDNP